MSSKILLSLFIWFSLNDIFNLKQHCFPYITDSFQCYFHISNSIQTFQTDWVDSSTKYCLVIHNYCSTDYPLFCHPSCTSVMHQFLRLIMIYFIMGFKPFSSKLLVAMSSNCRSPSRQSILCILQIFTIPYRI